MLEILLHFPLAKTLMMDNEPSFSSTQFKSFVQRCGINLYFADPRHSTSNGQIERAHSTLSEIARCIKDDLNLDDYSEVLIRAAQKYNMTIHTITNQRPYDILYNKIEYDTIPQLLKQAQEKMLNSHNRGRKEKDYLVGEVIYEKKHGERNKLNSRYKNEVVKENLHNKVIINNRNRTIHKDNIKS